MNQSKKFCNISNIFCIVISLIYAFVLVCGIMLTDLFVSLSMVIEEYINSNVIFSMLNDIIKTLAILYGIFLGFIVLTNIGTNIALWITGIKCKTPKGYLINGIFKMVYCIVSLITMFIMWGCYNEITMSIIKWVWFVIGIGIHIPLFVFSLLQCIKSKINKGN